MKQQQRGGALFYSRALSDDALCEQLARALGGHLENVATVMTFWLCTLYPLLWEIACWRGEVAANGFAASNAVLQELSEELLLYPHLFIIRR